MGYCICFDVPKEGTFTKGGRYSWDYGLDCVVVIDNSGTSVLFEEHHFLWYFRKC